MLSIKQVRSRAAAAGVSRSDVEAAIHGPRAEMANLILAAEETTDADESKGVEDSWMTHSFHGFIHEEEGTQPQPEWSAQDAIAANEAFESAMTFFAEEQWGEAKAAFLSAISLGDTRASRCYNGIGLCLSMPEGASNADLEAALKSFEQSVEVAPENYGAWHNRAHILERLGRADEAEEMEKATMLLENAGQDAPAAESEPEPEPEPEPPEYAWIPAASLKLQGFARKMQKKRLVVAVVGGCSGSSSVEQVDLLDLASMSWLKHPGLACKPSVDALVCSSVDSRCVLVAGGCAAAHKGTQYHDSVEALSFGGALNDKLSCRSVELPALPAGRKCSVGGVLSTAGDRGAGKLASPIERFDGRKSDRLGVPCRDAGCPRWRGAGVDRSAAEEAVEEEGLQRCEALEDAGHRLRGRQCEVRRACRQGASADRAAAPGRQAQPDDIPGRRP